MIMLPASIPGSILGYLSLVWGLNPPLAVTTGIAVTVLMAAGYIVIMDYVHKKLSLTMSIKVLLEDRENKKVMFFGIKNIGSKNIYDVVLKLNKSEFADHIGVHLDGIKGWDIAKFNKIEPGATEFNYLCSFEYVNDEDHAKHIKDSYNIKEKYNIELEVRAKNEMTVFACFVYRPSLIPAIIPRKPKISFSRLLDA
jgi:hypothetical protein